MIKIMQVCFRDEFSLPFQSAREDKHVLVQLNYPCTRKSWLVLDILCSLYVALTMNIYSTRIKGPKMQTSEML